MGTKAFEVYGEFDLKGAADVKRKMHDADTQAKKLSDSYKTMTALVSTAAVVAVMRFGTEAVKAFAESEKFSVRLQKSVEAAGQSWAVYGDDVESAVERMMMLGAYTDEELNAGLARLTQSTGDVTKSLDMMTLAMDIARGTGKPLEDTAVMLGKVYGGNLGVLQRYGITLTGVSTSTEALAALQKRYAGQAEAYGETTEGAMLLIANAADEVKESFGEGLASGIDGNMKDAAQSLMDFRDAAEGAGKVVNGALGSVMWASDQLAESVVALGIMGGAYSDTFRLMWDEWTEGGYESEYSFRQFIGAVESGEVAIDGLSVVGATAAGVTDDLAAAAQDAAGSTTALNDGLQEEYDLLQDVANALSPAKQGALDMYEANIRVKDAQEDYNTAVKDFGENSDEARAAALKLEGAKNRAVEQSGQYQSALDAETKRVDAQYWAAKRAAGAFGDLNEAKRNTGGVGSSQLTRHGGGGIATSGMYSLQAGEHVLRASQVERIIDRGGSVSNSASVVVIADPRYTDMNKLHADVSRATASDVSDGELLARMGMG